MKKSILTSLLFILPFLGQSQKTNLSQDIDAYVKNVIKINEIPGMAVGVIKDNKIVFQQYYGTETLDNNKKVDANTMFRIYSTTKLMSNVGLFQLIEKGKISLDDKISKYLDNLPKEWQDVQIKNLLSHSSGLPDRIRFSDIPLNASPAEIINRLAKEKMEFETGHEYSYNQTNYMLITMIIEKLTGGHFESFILKNQFPESQKQVVFSSNSVEKIPNRVGKYNYNGEAKKYEKNTSNDGTVAHSANGLAITLPAFLKWSNHLNNNDFLKEETKRMMWKPFDFSNKRDVFGFGWEINNANDFKSYGFSGGNVSVYGTYPDNKMAIIIMFNGSKGFPVQYQMMNHIAGIMDQRLVNPSLLAEEYITSEFLAQPNRKKEIYGYRMENDQVIFSYQYPQSLGAEFIKSVSLAGSFNDWNPENPSYQLKPKGKGLFELALPKSGFEKGKTYEFKFVMNKSGWLLAPYQASNVEGDGALGSNLTLKID